MLALSKVIWSSLTRFEKWICDRENSVKSGASLPSWTMKSDIDGDLLFCCIMTRSFTVTELSDILLMDNAKESKMADS